MAFLRKVIFQYKAEYSLSEMSASHCSYAGELIYVTVSNRFLHDILFVVTFGANLGEIWEIP